VIKTYSSYSPSLFPLTHTCKLRPPVMKFPITPPQLAEVSTCCTPQSRCRSAQSQKYVLIKLMTYELRMSAHIYMDSQRWVSTCCTPQSRCRRAQSQKYDSVQAKLMACELRMSAHTHTHVFPEVSTCCTPQSRCMIAQSQKFNSIEGITH